MKKLYFKFLFPSMTSALTVALWVVFILFREQIFTLFGANSEVMPKTVEYGKWIIWFLPFFVFAPFMGVLFTLIGELLPIQITKFFMNATPEVLAAAPSVFRLFFPMFLFLGVTVLADYYLQSVMEAKMSMVIGLSHSVLISGLMIFCLPSVLGLDGVWLAMPVAELAVSLIGAGYIVSMNVRQNTGKTVEGA